MIITKDCGCEIIIKTTNGFASIEFVRYMNKCEKHTNEEPLLVLLDKINVIKQKEITDEEK